MCVHTCDRSILYPCRCSGEGVTPLLYLYCHGNTGIARSRLVVPAPGEELVLLCSSQVLLWPSKVSCSTATQETLCQVTIPELFLQGIEPPFNFPERLCLKGICVASLPSGKLLCLVLAKHLGLMMGAMCGLSWEFSAYAASWSSLPKATFTGRVVWC